MKLEYRKGLHVIGTLITSDSSQLTESSLFRSKLDSHIRELDLNIVGEVYHDFPEGGFTGVVCLTESHLSVHTWPEHNIATLDVFLSNYQQVNDGKARALFRICAEYFNARIENYHEVMR